jgi:hypothetical protein
MPINNEAYMREMGFLDANQNNKEIDTAVIYAYWHMPKLPEIPIFEIPEIPEILDIEELFSKKNTNSNSQSNTKNKTENQRTRKTNLSRAIDAAIEKIGRKPSFDELWRFFQDDKDETGYIEDFKDTHITWRDTKGKLHDTKKETIQNQLSQR